MVGALGALLAIAEADRKAQTLKTITNNLGSAVESMSRSIRTGSNYRCGSSSGVDCPSPGATSLYFRPIGGGEWAYRWNSNTLNPHCQNALGCIQRSQDGGANWADITAPEVVVLNPITAGSGPGLTFYLFGSTQGCPGDCVQPKVTILLRGYVKVTEALNSKFDLQTTITQRIYDQ